MKQGLPRGPEQVVHTSAVVVIIGSARDPFL